MISEWGGGGDKDAPNEQEEGQRDGTTNIRVREISTNGFCL